MILGATAGFALLVTPCCRHYSAKILVDKFPAKSRAGERMGTGRRKLGLYLAAAYRLVGCSLLAALALWPATTHAQDARPGPLANSPAQQTSSQVENTGDDFVRPLNLFQFLYEYKTAPGSGAEIGYHQSSHNGHPKSACRSPDRFRPSMGARPAHRPAVSCEEPDQFR
jgi:hypothetical protein